MIGLPPMPGQHGSQGYDSLDERRRRLLEALRDGGQAGAGGRLLGPRPGARRALPLFGGGGRVRGSASDLPSAALPALTYNPWLAQLKQGLPGVTPPTHPGQAAGFMPSNLVNDITGQPQGQMPATGVPGAPAASPASPYTDFQSAASSQAGAPRYLSHRMVGEPGVQGAPSQYDASNFIRLLLQQTARAV